jgi:salicylate hydroxylase
MAMHVVIAGAGISGLSAAISLRRSGHRVTIYERSSLSNEVGAAINVPPNVSRFLLPWGLDPDKYGFIASNGVYFISPTTLEEFATHDHSHNVELYGQSLYHAHRVDLHESLKDIATDPDGPGIPAIIHMKSAVTSYVSYFNSVCKTLSLIVKLNAAHRIRIFLPSLYRTER